MGGEGERLGWCEWKMREVRVVWVGEERDKVGVGGEGERLGWCGWGRREVTVVWAS